MSRRGSALLDVLVGTALGVVLLSALTAAVASGSRLMTTTGARGEADDTVHLAVEAFTFDARRAGFDPAGAGIPPLAEGLLERLTFHADLDGNGAVDAASEETTAYICAPAAHRLSRVIGRQSLPLADGVTQCAFRYLDASGTPIPLPPAGLDAAARARVRAVGLDLTLRGARIRAPSERHVLVALRAPE
jgi:hypothetical protein